MIVGDSVLLHVRRRTFAVSRFVRRNLILCEAALIKNPKTKTTCQLLTVFCTQLTRIHRHRDSDQNYCKKNNFHCF